ncbi:GNAT family N-acetyltransferase [Brevibacillus borstelensis]|uniref:GNAT family N-acetyltransferase n=1 Tax=Brevibacillus borstelensis TaxID=45462 RepID=UPI003CC90E6B
MSDLFRLATKKDAEALLELISRAYQTIRDLEIEFTAVHADLPMILENLSEHTCFVHEREGKLLAAISLRSLVEVTEYPFLYWFAVDPDYQNQGIGRRDGCKRYPACPLRNAGDIEKAPVAPFDV